MAKRVSPTIETPTAVPAIQLPAGLGTGQFQRVEGIGAGGGGGGLPYLGFYSARSNNAAKMVDALGRITDGHPFVRDEGGEYYSVKGAAFLSLAEWPHWYTVDTAFRPERVYLTPPTGKDGRALREIDGQRLSEAVLSITLVLETETIKLHADVLATLTTWRDTKLGALRTHLDAVGRAASTDWVAKHPEFAAVPEVLRIASVLDVQSITSKAGRPYTVAVAKPVPLTITQGKAVAAYMASGEGILQLEAARAGFDARKAELEALA